MSQLLPLVQKMAGITPGWRAGTFSWLRGPVVAANTKYTSETSTSSRSVTLSDGQTGSVDMPVTTTTGRHEFWIKTPQGEHHVWLQKDYVSVCQGQTVTIVYYGRTFIAYIVHNTREEMIVEANLRKLAGRPSFGMTLLQTFLIFPICMAVPAGLLQGLGTSLFPIWINHHVISPIYAAVIVGGGLLNAAWLIVGYPVRFVFYLLRRRVLEPKVQAQVAALRGYGRA